MRTNFTDRSGRLSDSSNNWVLDRIYLLSSVSCSVRSGSQDFHAPFQALPFSGFQTLALLPTEGPEPCRLLEQVTYMSHCGFCVSEGNACVSRYPSPQFVRTGFTDHSSRLSVSPTVCDQKTGVLVRSVCRILKSSPFRCSVSIWTGQHRLLPRHCVLYLRHHHLPPHHHRGPHGSFCLHSACLRHSLGPRRPTQCWN